MVDVKRRVMRGRSSCALLCHVNKEAWLDLVGPPELGCVWVPQKPVVLGEEAVSVYRNCSVSSRRTSLIGVTSRRVCVCV